MFIKSSDEEFYNYFFITELGMRIKTKKAYSKHFLY